MKSRTFLAVLVGTVILVAGGIGAWTSTSEGASSPSDNDALTAARFDLTIDGRSLALFSSLEISSGYGADELELVTRSGNTEIKLPGKRTPPTVTLKRGMTRNIELAAWHELVILGDVAAAKRNVVLTAYNEAGSPVARYHLTDAWPQKLEIDSLSAGTSQALLETVTMTCEFIQRVSV